MPREIAKGRQERLIPLTPTARKAIAKLLEIDPEARTIVSSGYSNDPVMADFRKYGFKGKGRVGAVSSGFRGPGTKTR